MARFLVRCFGRGLPLIPSQRRLVPLLRRHVQTPSRGCSRHVREGVFIGALAPPDANGTDSTLAANPHLKQIFGYPADARGRRCRAVRTRPVRRCRRARRLHRAACRGQARSPITCFGCGASTVHRCGWRSRARAARPARSGGLLRSKRSFATSANARRLDDQAQGHLSADPAVREDGCAGTDHFGRRARIEQSAGDDPELGGAAVGNARSTNGQTRRLGHSRRSRTRRAHRPQPADVRAEAAVHTRDDRPEQDRHGNDRAAGI